MDKIDIANWPGYFDDSELTVRHSDERYSETSFRFSEQGLASGQVTTFSTPDMTLVDLSLTPANPLMLCDTEGLEGAESVFILEGNVQSRFAALKQPLNFGKLHHNIQYSVNYEGNHIVHPGHFHTLSIAFNLPYLNTLLQSAEKDISGEILSSIEKKQHFLASPYSLRCSPAIMDIIRAMTECRFQGAMRYVFMESKMMELFVLQMDQLNNVRGATGMDKWSHADKEKLYAVHAFINTSFLEPVTLKELTRLFALNEFKLKKGYKHFFHTTVFGHIHHLRMQYAKALLAEKQMSIAEVSYQIGYNTPGSFSSEFKKKFGYSPKEV